MKQLLIIAGILGIGFLAYWFVIKPSMEKKDDEDTGGGVQSNWKDNKDGTFTNTKTQQTVKATSIKAIRPRYKRVFGNEVIVVPGTIVLEVKKYANNDEFFSTLAKAKIKRTSIYDSDPNALSGFNVVDIITTADSRLIEVEANFIDTAETETVNGKPRLINKFNQDPMKVPFLYLGV